MDSGDQGKARNSPFCAANEEPPATADRSHLVFVLPNGDELLDILVGAASGKPIYRFTPERVVEHMRQVERLKETVAKLERSLERKRAKIRILMAALADERDGA